jgi:hypothetical protein
MVDLRIRSWKQAMAGCWARQLWYLEDLQGSDVHAMVRRIGDRPEKCGRTLDVRGGALRRYLKIFKRR